MHKVYVTFAWGILFAIVPRIFFTQGSDGYKTTGSCKQDRRVADGQGWRFAELE